MHGNITYSINVPIANNRQETVALETRPDTCSLTDVALAVVTRSWIVSMWHFVAWWFWHLVHREPRVVPMHLVVARNHDTGQSHRQCYPAPRQPNTHGNNMQKQTWTSTSRMKESTQSNKHTNTLNGTCHVITRHQGIYECWYNKLMNIYLFTNILIWRFQKLNKDTVDNKQVIQ